MLTITAGTNTKVAEPGFKGVIHRNKRSIYRKCSIAIFGPVACHYRNRRWYNVPLQRAHLTVRADSLMAQCQCQEIYSSWSSCCTFASAFQASRWTAIQEEYLAWFLTS